MFAESQQLQPTGEVEAVITGGGNEINTEIVKEGVGNTAAERSRKEHRPDKKRRPAKKKDRNEKIKVTLVQVLLQATVCFFMNFVLLSCE